MTTMRTGRVGDKPREIKESSAPVREAGRCPGCGNPLQASTAGGRGVCLRCDTSHEGHGQRRGG